MTIDRSDPLYLLGCYESRYRLLKAIFAGNNLYLGHDEVKMCRAILGFTDVPLYDPSEAEAPPETCVSASDFEDSMKEI